MKSFALLALAAAALPSVLGHGFVDKIVVNGGKTYKGPEPGGSAGNSIIRLIQSTNPNHIQDGAALACGKGAATRGAKLSGDANPGDKLSFNWNAGDGTPWPHDSGPLITYMAKCDGDCSSFDATKGKWFKIDQTSKTKVPGNEWYQDTVLHKGKMYTVTIPDKLAPGNYLVRHEIIALHLADGLNGAEFYPSCSQWKIGGSQTGTPDVTASFPGAYKNTDPGIHINIWDKSSSAYPYPGPAVAKFSGSSTGASTTKSGSASSATSTSVSSSSSDDNSDDNSSSDDNSNDANDDSGSNSDDGCDDEGNDDSGDDNNDDDCDDGSSTASTDDGDVVTKYITVTKTVTVTPTATPKYRARETSSAPRRSRRHLAKGRSS